MQRLGEQLDFGYKFLMVFDVDEHQPGLFWAERTYEQGFVRTPSIVNVGVPASWERANVFLSRGQYRRSSADVRVFRFPFFLGSGEVVVAGPEEEPSEERHVECAVGHYALTVALRELIGSDGLAECRVVLYLDRVAVGLSCSEIIVADGEMTFSDDLIEVGEIA